MDIIKLNEVETATCSRCCGSGKFSHCIGYGDRCFKCHGSGKTKTKRGTITNAYIRSQRVTKKAAKDLVVGSLIYHSIGLGGSDFQRKWVKVVAIELLPDSRISIRCNSIQYSTNTSAEYLFESRIEGVDDATTFDDGMAFQATLTKTGKPTKAMTAAHRAWLDAYQITESAK